MLQAVANLLEKKRESMTLYQMVLSMDSASQLHMCSQNKIKLSTKQLVIIPTFNTIVCLYIMSKSSD